MARSWFLLFSTALAISSGCTEGLRGVPTRELSPSGVQAPAATGKIVAAATTHDADGLRVLWNGRTAGMQVKWHAWIAGSQEELEAVWKAAAAGTPPAIDFSKYVVIAEAGEGGVCNPKIVGIEAEASGLLRLRYDPATLTQTCILLATRIARIVAVPRRVLPATVVFMNGYAFEVPDVPFG